MAVRRVAVTTWWHYENYGSALQATALYDVLKKNRFDPDVINYMPDGKIYPTSPEADQEHHANYAEYPRIIDTERSARFKEYLNKNLTFTKEVRSDDDFFDLNDQYSAFITGSDQIWAPRVFDERYYLDYVYDNRRKIAYAPSIGLPTIENEYVKAQMRLLISKFFHISVREEQGAALIKNELGIDDVEVMPDPTLLLSYDEWRKIIPKTQPLETEKYILCYFLGENKNAWQHVDKISKQTGYKIKIIPVLMRDIQYGEFIHGVGPNEFFNLIDNAELVLTDSFHGGIFSIITHTPFYVFERFRPDSLGSQNSRVYNLLEKVGLVDRLIKYDDKLKKRYNFEIGFNEVSEDIRAQKKRAISWLRLALAEVDKVEAVKLDAQITYNAHSIEKSLSNPNFERGHAFRVVRDLVGLLQEYSDSKLDKKSPAYQSALSVLNEFYLLHKNSSYHAEIKTILGQHYEEIVGDAGKTGGAERVSKTSKRNNSRKNFKELSLNRQSIRNYLDKDVDEKDIREVIEIAQKSPSTCNRQEARVYYMTDKNIINQVLKIQGTLHDYPTPPLLFLVTATDDAYLFDTERNNGYIDGSLFAMSLLYALEYKGIGACPLHAMFTDDTRRKIIDLLNIPENEKLIFFISAGYFDEEALACKSFRYPTNYMTRKITRLTPGAIPRKISEPPLSAEQHEINRLQAENNHLNDKLSSFLSTKRSARLLLGNLKRHYSRGILGKIKRTLRIRTRIRSTVKNAHRLTKTVYWFFKDIMIDYRTRQVVNNKLEVGDRIPKVIHYIWVGGAEKPDSVKKYIKSWKEACPDYEIIEWNEKNFNISKNRYADEAYKAKKWAFVTDYIRLDVLERYGGIYMDSDVEVLKNLDVFLKEPAFSSFEAGDPSQVYLPTGIMASERNGKWVKFLKSYYSHSRSFFLEDGNIDTTTNTSIITRMTVEKYGIKLNNKLQKYDDFTMYPSEYFCPKSWSTREINLTNNSYTIHHFAGSWLPPEIHNTKQEEGDDR